MPLTKQKIKFILKEEIDTFIKEQEETDKSGKKQIEMLEKLLKALDRLDISIDYLSSAVTGTPSLGIGLSQATLGRLASVATRQKEVIPVAAPRTAETPTKQERD